MDRAPAQAMSQPRTKPAPQATNEREAWFPPPLPVFRAVDGQFAAAPGLSPRGVLAMQRAQGNHAVSSLLGSRPVARRIQRCGGEIHEGCSCAEDAPLEQILPISRSVEPSAGAIRRFTDGTPDAPSTELPDGSPYAALPGGLLDMLRRTLTGKTYWRWANDKPTNLGAAIDLLPSADLNTLVQLHNRLEPLGLWKFIGTMKGLWTTSSLGIDFTETGSIQAALPEDKFCKDTAIGESYHKGKSCWREMVEPGTPGLHVCLPGEVHIDPHQTVEKDRKDVGIAFGGGSWISFPSICMYSLVTLIDHMMDVEGGRSVNVYTRRGQDYQKIETEQGRVEGMLKEHPELSAEKTTLDGLRQRLDDVGVTMRGWAIRGFEGDDGSAEAKVVLDELTAIEQGIEDVRKKVSEAEASDDVPSPMPWF